MIWVVLGFHLSCRDGHFSSPLTWFVCEGDTATIPIQVAGNSHPLTASGHLSNQMQTILHSEGLTEVPRADCTKSKLHHYT